MSKGKIDVVFNVTSYGSDPKVLMRAMLRKEGSNAKGASIAGTLVLKPRHEIKKFETFQLIAANFKKLDELDLFYILFKIIKHFILRLIKYIILKRIVSVLILNI